MDIKSKLNPNVINAPLSGIRKISELTLQMKDVVRLDLGEPDFDTPKHIKDAAVKALNEGFTHYTAVPGIVELRKAIAEKLKKENNMEYNFETEITVTVGGIGAIFSALQTILSPDDEVIISDPAWPAYLGVLGILNAKPIFVTLKEKNGFNIMPEEIQDKITKKTKAIIINSPNNPTGGVMSEENLKGIAKIARENNIFIFSDESYEKLILGDKKHISLGSLPGMRDLVISQFTFSKTYAMTGWRVGFVSASSEITKELRKVSLYTVTHVTSIVQKAALSALNGPQDCVKEMVDAYRLRGDILVDGLNSIGKISCIKPQGAFYAFANISKLNMKSEDFVIKMIKEAGVSAVPGSSFGNSGEGFVRFCFANSNENIKEAVKRINKFVKSL
ncbi:MAG: pyridoxal phosphate-dependent aminotransferase [Candidatus Firestonebacteria bacterium]